MDPYVIMTCREQEWKSTVQKNAGKKPVWEDEHFDFEVHYLGDDLHFHVCDEDHGKDGNVGEGSTKLSALVNEGGISEWFEIQHKGESAGKVHLRTEWMPKHGHNKE